MRKYTEIQRADCKVLREQVNDALRQLGEDIGLNIQAGNGSYDENHVTFKLTLTVAGHDPMKHDFELYAHLFGVQPRDYGREFSVLGKRYRLIGIKLKAKAYPFVVEHEGKRFKMPQNTVTGALARQEIAAAKGGAA